MLRSRFLPMVFGASLVLAAACSDSDTSTAPLTSTRGTPPQLTLTGTVHRSGNKINEVILATDDGQEIPLSGENASTMASVENAGVEVRGAWNVDGAFEVADFLVRMVDGAPVLDGVLIAVYDRIVDNESIQPISYGLSPTRGGPTIPLTDPSAELLTHLGERLWVAAVGDGAPMAFGVISER